MRFLLQCRVVESSWQCKFCAIMAFALFRLPCKLAAAQHAIIAHFFQTIWRGKCTRIWRRAEAEIAKGDIHRNIAITDNSYSFLNIGASMHLVPLCNADLCRLHTAFLHWPLSSAATKKVQGPDTT
jgi:hypothetical protein